MSKLYYISFYKNDEAQNARIAVPAAVGKMDYIIRTMQALGCCVEVLSLSGEARRDVFFKKAPAFTEDAGGVRVRYFDRYASSFRPFRVVLRKYSELKIKRSVLKLIKQGDNVVLYHSLGALFLIRALKRKRIPFVLEAEEIYSDVICAPRKRERETALMRKANGFIFPTKLLSGIVNTEGRPEAIVHGVYDPAEDMKPKKFGSMEGERPIHCVYAGTFDPRKGSIAAIKAAEHLTRDYHLHIIGFGHEGDIENIRRLIEETSKRTEAEITYDGLKKGTEYLSFLQCCDIGLATQDPDASFNGTSFPSKILSYLSNGLSVVSVAIPAVEGSAVSGCISFYREQTPEAIARAIMSVDVKKPSVSRELLEKLSEDFRSDLKELLEQVK